MKRIGVIALKIRQFSSKKLPEMKYLNVAEKNDAAKTISGFLSNGTARRREGLSVYNKIYEFETNVRGQQAKMTMTSVSGHLLNYEFVSSYRGWRTCDPQQLFDAPVKKSCPQDYEPIKRTLEREVRSAQALIVWTDCDREGENIGFEVIEVCRAIKPNIAVYRAKFSEITAVAARRALANLVQPDKRQSEAVDIRQELDLRIGAAFTRFQTLRLQRIFPSQIAEKLISYGSCQIPTLGFVAQRYKEAEEFVSEPFWKLKVTHTIDELTVEFNWARIRLFDKEACEDYLMLCLADPVAKVESVVTKPKNKWRPNPMDTVALEKLGSRKLKINAKTVMSIAEKLYQQGIISYPRTETNCFSKEIDLRSLVEHHTPHPEWGQFASRVLEWGPDPRNGQKSDQAHPPIHPIKLTTGLSGDEKRVYELVVRHFLACVSKDATGSETVVTISIAGEKFTANGLCIYERNYLDVYPYEKWNAKEIHRYEEGTTFEPDEISMQEGATTAPPLLTEADLIALMEKHGIGTDATHAEHIHTVKERGYIGEVDRGFLVPGTIGMGLYEGYHAMELPLAEPDLRAAFEVDLKRICTGERNPKDVLVDQIQKYKETYRIIMQRARSLDEQLARRLNEVPQQNASEDPLPTVRLDEVLPCPKCNPAASMALKQKKDTTSYFLSCVNFPDCKNAVWFPDEFKSLKLTETACPKCGPAYRMIEAKFKQINYLALLNASSSTYTTCIACDSKFRNLFNINADCVKKIGAIVSDQNSLPANRNNRNINEVLGRSTGSSRAPPSNLGTNSSTRSNAPSTNNNSVPSNSRSRNTSANSSGNRNTESTAPGRSNNSGPSNTTSNSSGNRNTGSTAPGRSNNSGPPNSRSKSTTANQSSGISRYQGWGTMERDPTPVQETSSNLVTADNFDGFDDSFDDMFLSNDWDVNINTNNCSRHNNNSNSNPTTSPWGLSGSTVPINNNPPSTTNMGRQENETEAFGDDAVRCTSCNQVAKSLIVRKEGPNTGRPFYVCPADCSFFKWGDESPAASTNQPSANATMNRGWGNAQPDDVSTNRASTNRGWGNIQPDDTNTNRASTNRGWGNIQPDDANTNRASTNRGWGNIQPDDANTNRASTNRGWGNIQPDDANTNRASTNRGWGNIQPDDATTNRRDNIQPDSRTANSWSNIQADTASSSRWNNNQPRNNNTNNRWANIQPDNGINQRVPSSNDPSDLSRVLCTCNTPAVERTVRKEGPNKGRQFFVCSSQTGSCNFFKWGDENTEPSSSGGGQGSSSWGTGSSNNRDRQPSSSSSTWGRSNSTNPSGSSSSSSNAGSKKRKCGLCRMEGHTKLKCPRKDEFQGY